MIEHISAVTFAVRDMARSVEFYKKLGFELLYGGDRAAFSSLKAGEGFVNLAANEEYEHRGLGARRWQPWLPSWAAEAARDGKD